MWDDLLTVALVAAVSWLAAYAFYWYTSRQQRQIEAEIEQVRQLLETPKQDNDGKQ